MELKVVPGGVTSVMVAVAAELGPELVRTCVYVMLLPACTGTGLAVLLIERLAEPATTTLAEALLFPGFASVVDEETEPVCVIVDPAVAVALTPTTKLKLAVALAARLPMVQVSVPRLHVHPAEPVNDTAVVPVGSVSVRLTVVAAAGPPLITVWV